MQWLTVHTNCSLHFLLSFERPSTPGILRYYCVCFFPTSCWLGKNVENSIETDDQPNQPTEKLGMKKKKNDGENEGLT